tara:strand:+ start:13733 stop:14662 length:930 start_codon:yes stop_codon:yes gene_type:complete
MNNFLTENLKKSWTELGYVRIPNFIDAEDIDLLKKEIKKNIQQRFLNHAFTQHTHRYEKLRFNKDNLLEESIQNPHAYVWSREVRYAVAKIICNKKIIEIINFLSGENKKRAIWQSMYFDKSTGTLGHQDTYYLDTIDGGEVNGVLFALEDFKIDSGPFYVIPKSHVLGPLFKESKNDADDRFDNHDLYASTLKEFEEKNFKNVTPQYLKKGEILIWNSLLVHGALEPKDTKLSRKSLTAHYYPIDKDLKGFKKRPNTSFPKNLNVPIMGYPTEYQNFKEKIKLIIKIINQSLFKKGIVEMDMRRDSYK